MRTIRKLALVGAAVLPVVLATTVVNIGPAHAHGGLTFPATRTYACYVDGLAGGGGDLNPTNPACAEAVAIGGKQPLWDWFGNLLPNIGDQHRTIPDGQLCGPGSQYAAYRIAHPDWPKTTLQSGGNITIRYNAWAPHPGTWYQYVTRDGWNPNQPIGWGDLDPVPFDVVTNPSINGSGPHGAEYTWPATLPNKSGYHVIFSIWERSDSPEAFYNCSDVIFEGGPGPGPSPSPSPSPDPGPGPSPSPSPDPGPGPGNCTATVTVDSSWSGGFQATVTVTNTGTTSLSTWTANWTMPAGATIAQGWNGTFTQSGSTATAVAAQWNGSVPPGGSTTAGFLGNGPATPAPSGATCS